jgi:endonuclease/exonuclease/phosphatase family metal-dependent hydrolase
MTIHFSVMTYNVHSCIGMDGKVSPLRIAEVIAHYNPDIVALQELDAGLARSDLVDQAHLIAKSLEMSYHFHSSIQVEEGEYGNAVLSRFPIHLVKGGELPTHPINRNLERRGAVWAEVELKGITLQVLGTHLGLNRRERICQANALTGPEWLGHPQCRGPVVLCGDFNALPGSFVYRHFIHRFRDAYRAGRGKRLKGTWPVRLPLMRLDYLFLSPDIKVRRISAPRTPQTMVASDHLPVVAALELP